MEIIKALWHIDFALIALCIYMLCLAFAIIKREKRKAKPLSYIGQAVKETTNFGSFE